MTERETGSKIEVIIDEAINGHGKSMIKAYVMENGVLKGHPLCRQRGVTPKEISLDIFEIGIIHSGKRRKRELGSIFISASRKVPG